MNTRTMRRMMALGVALAGSTPAAAGIQAAPEVWRTAAAMESATPPAAEATKPPAAEAAKPAVPLLDKPEAAKPAAAEAPPNDADKKRKTKPVPKPVAVEPLTPEQATFKAADPKAPTGALIVKPPEDLPPTGAGSPAPSAPARR